MLTAETVEYIWKNYRHVIDRDSDILALRRAAMAAESAAPNDAPFLRAGDEKYAHLGQDELINRLAELESTRRGEIAEQVLNKYGAEIFLNTCGHCGALLNTPESEQCLKCGKTWFGTNPNRRKV